MGILARLKALMSTATAPLWTSHPGPYMGGPIAFTSDGAIPMNWPWNFGQLGWDPIAAGMNSVAYSCIMLYARTISQLTPEHCRSRDDDGTDVVKTSPFARVMRAPNEYSTRSDFLFNLVTSLLYNGNGYALALRNDRQEIEELHLLNPRGTRYRVAEDGSVFYTVSGANELVDPLIDFQNPNNSLQLVVPQRDILHLRVYCPRHLLLGESPLSAAVLPMLINNAGLGSTANFYNNQSKPSGVLSTDNILTATQAQALREAWEAQTTGAKQGGTPVLTAGLKWQTVTMTAQDAQLSEMLKYSVADIARVFGVPLALINDMTGATWNNTETLMKAWLSQGLGFYLRHIELAFARSFRFAPGDYVEFDVNDLIRADFKDRMEGLAKAVLGGIYSPNEARKTEGLPKAKDGDEPRLQQQVQPLSWKPPDPAAAKPPPAPGDAAPPPDPAAESARMLAELREAMRRAA